MKLRPYQDDAISQIKQYYQNGVKKVLLIMPTGTGKTAVFSSILKMTYEKNNQAIMVVRGKKLVDQASQRLFSMGVDHGCIQANHWNQKPAAKIQICSIDTLARRNIIPPADFIVIDEAHLARSNSFEWLINNYPDAYFLPVTATPNVKKGLRHIADEYVQPITFTEAVEQGFLVAPKYFAPTKLNLENVKVKKSTGDYDEKELEQIMDQDAIYGDIIEHWQSLGQSLPTLCFCVSVEHSKKIRDQFESYGIAAAHIDAHTKDSERSDTIERLEKGEIKIIVNVGCLTTGVDIPCIQNIIFARPTKSYNLYIQMCGRGTRPYKNKDHFKILDHANNISAHGFIENEPEVDLEAKPKRAKQEIEKTGVVICTNCFFAFDPWEHAFICPNCKEPIAEKKKSSIKEEAAQLAELKVDLEVIGYLKELKAIRKDKDHKRGWIWHRMKAKYGEETASKYIPKRKVPSWVNRRT